ncbi:MAG: ABC transporter ATP-binding protein, partial [Candidatus Heimdallarchaeota archaeon]|nr:ABC transporter ATP-binding protein [Candidatus Heimdallarchaeota archaeon]MCK4878380.1 ABC transporter ATP-binding protein [Candidatus Heimdallarchaeota archaeon]
MPILEVKNLKTYFHTREGSVKAVDNVSFKLEKGEVLGLAGESGCGKTTTCLSIMRMIPSPGEILEGELLYDKAFEVMDDPDSVQSRFKNRFSRRNDANRERTRNLLELREHEMRRIRGNHIAMVFQGAMNALNPVHRVGNQILEAIKIHDPEIEKEEAWDRVIDILETVGI